MHFTTSAGVALLALGHTVLASPAPVAEKRDMPRLCKDSTVDAEGTTGFLFCFDSDGNDLTCDECQGFSGNTPAKSSDGIRCHVSNGDSDSLGDLTSCPGDDPPETSPDGNPSSDIATGVLDSYCSAAGAGGLFGWTTYAVCYAYTFASAQGNDLDEATAGAKRKLR